MDVLQVVLALLGIAATALLGWIKSDLGFIRKELRDQRERGDDHATRLAVLEALSGDA